MSNDEEVKWEPVAVGIYYGLTRIKVEGGYIYRDFTTAEENPAVAMCFVPDVDLQRYQAHLRDAYNKGFDDGMVEANSIFNEHMKA